MRSILPYVVTLRACPMGYYSKTSRELGTSCPRLFTIYIYV